MRQDIVEGQKTGLDVPNLMAASISKLALADGVVQSAGMQMIDAASPAVSLGCRIALREEFFDEVGVPLAAFGMSEIQELPNREVPGMRCHKVKKTGFNLCVAEGPKRSELCW